MSLVCEETRVCTSACVVVSLKRAAADPLNVTSSVSVDTLLDILRTWRQFVVDLVNVPPRLFPPLSLQQSFS